MRATLEEAFKRALEQKQLKEQIDAWQDEPQEKTMPKHVFKPTNNASRATFHFIRENPNLTQKELVFELGVRGFKKTTVASLITQFIRSGFVQRVDGKLTALIKEYQPIKAKPAKKKAVEIMRRPSVPKEIQAIIEDIWTPSQILDKLSVMQAKQLYTELKQIFSN
jgi:hypothetical protein